MKTTITKKIEKTNKEFKVPIKATRYRDSEDVARIRLDVGNQSIIFNTYQFGYDYEQAALVAARLLDEIALNPCSLPEEEEKK